MLLLTAFRQNMSGNGGGPAQTREQTSKGKRGLARARGNRGHDRDKRN